MMNKEISTLYINGQVYSVRATVHAQQRMIQRNVSEDVIVKNIYALGKIRIMSLKVTKDEVIIIDKKTNTSSIIGFNGNVITVITVIGKSNVFVKSGTTIINL